MAEEGELDVSYPTNESDEQQPSTQPLMATTTAATTTVTPAPLVVSGSFKEGKSSSRRRASRRPSLDADEFLNLLHGSDPVKVELNRLENEVRGHIALSIFLFYFVVIYEWVFKIYIFWWVVYDFEFFFSFASVFKAGNFCMEMGFLFLLLGGWILIWKWNFFFLYD